MTVLKLSKSGKQLQVVTDEGVVFGCSIKLYDWLLKNPTRFVLMTRFEMCVSPGRFARSPVWTSDGRIVNDDNKVVRSYTSQSEDGLSKNFLDKKLDKKGYTDKMVEF